MQKLFEFLLLVGIPIAWWIWAKYKKKSPPKGGGKFPNLKWPQKINLGKIFAMLAVVIVGAIVILTVQEFRQEEWKNFTKFWEKHSSYCWLASIGLVYLIVWAWLQKPSSAHAASGGHAGGHEHGGNKGWIIFLLFLVLGGIVWPAVQMFFGIGQRTHTAPSGQIDSGPWVSITALPDMWTPVVVGKNVYVHWTIDGPGHILYRLNNSPEIEDWSGQQVVTPAPVGPYTAYFKAKGTNSVNLKVYLR